MKSDSLEKQPNDKQPALVTHVEKFFDKRAEKVNSTKAGTQLIETVAKVASLFEKIKLPIDKLLAVEKKIFTRMVEEMGWNPGLVAKHKGEEIPLSFPFDLRYAVTLPGNVAVMRDSPAHRQLALYDDTHAIDLLCPPGVTALSLGSGASFAPFTQFEFTEFGNNPKLDDSDNRVFGITRHNGDVLVWCVRHLAPPTGEELKKMGPKLKTGFIPGEPIGTTGFSGFYADTPPLCHVHVGVYVQEIVEGRVRFRGLKVEMK